MKKTVGVSFDLSDPMEKDLFQFAQRKTGNFGDLVKHLLFAWRYGYLEPDGEWETSRPDAAQVIRNSGLPFG
jgi:hypothetical protein